MTGAPVTRAAGTIRHRRAHGSPAVERDDRPAALAVGVALGHPDPADPAGVKPRLAQSIVRHREVYAEASDTAIEQYDDEVSEYYRSQGFARGWVGSVLERVRNAASLHGRHTLRAALEKRGLHSR